MGLAVSPCLVANPTALIDTIKGYVESGVSALLLGAGDGTISRSIGPLLHSNTTLGFIPLGTGNGIARGFGIRSIDEACQAIASGRTCCINVGCANNALFLNMVSIGMSVEVTKHLSQTLKRRTGHIAYLPSIIRAMSRRNVFDLALCMATETLRIPSIQVIMCNGAYVADWPRLGFIQPDDVLNIYALKQMSLCSLIRVTLDVWMGSHLQNDNLICYRATQIVIDTTPSLEVNVDGEIVEYTPLTISILPGSLRIFVTTDSHPDGLLRC